MEIVLASSAHWKDLKAADNNWMTSVKWTRNKQAKIVENEIVAVRYTEAGTGFFKFPSNPGF